MPIETAQSRPGELDVRKTSNSNLLVGLLDVAQAGSFNEVTVDAKGRVVGGSSRSYLTRDQVQEIVDAAFKQVRTIINNIPVPAVPTFASLCPAGIVFGWWKPLSQIPAGFRLCDGTNGTPNLLDRFILCVGSGEDPGATGGSNTHSHTFTGVSGSTSSDSAGTPSGTNSAPLLSMDSYTPAGAVGAPLFTGTPDTTGATSAGTPAGTNSAPAFTGNADTTGATSAGTPSGTVSQPSLTMNSYTPGGTNGSVSFTPSGTIAWPAGVPTAANESAHTHSVTSNVSVDNHASHTHTYTDIVNHTHTQSWTPQCQGGTTASNSGTHIMTSTATGGSLRSAGEVTVSAATANPTGGVATGTTAGPGAALTHTVNNPAVTSGAGSAHTHTISWPVGVPAFTGSSGTVSAQTFTGTPAVLTGTVSQPTFAGVAMSTHTHSFIPTGSVAAPTFTGTPLGTHSHSFTPAGTNSAPAFTGTPEVLTGNVSAPVFTGDALAGHDHDYTPAGILDTADNIPVYFKLAWLTKV